MATPHNSDAPLQELKHEAVPGFPKAFMIAIAVMALYLAIILISSPGKVDHYGKKGSDSHKTDTAH